MQPQYFCLYRPSFLYLRTPSVQPERQSLYTNGMPYFSAIASDIRQALLMDAEATCDADPAATSVDEVILAYPGFYALACYRLAHQLWQLGVPLLPRLIADHAGTRAMLTHPIDGDAARFYTLFGFIASPLREQQWLLLLKEACRWVR